MNDNPSLYKDHNGLPKRDIPLVLNAYIPKMTLSPNDRIIDVGAGDGGVTTNILRKHLGKDIEVLIGCDISDPMVQYANDNHRDEKIHFIVLDIAGHLPNEMNNSFNHVFSFYTFHWIKDQEKALRNMYNLMNEKGDCLIILMADMVLYPAFQVLSQTEKWAPFVKDPKGRIFPYHGKKHPEIELDRLMKKVGFKDVQCELQNKRYTYGNMKTMRSALLAVDPCNIPAPLEHEYMDDYIAALRARNLYDDTQPDHLSIAYSILVAYGKK